MDGKIDGAQATGEELRGNGVQAAAFETGVMPTLTLPHNTNRLSKANGKKIASVILGYFEKKPNGIEGLKECLDAQRGILMQAA